MKFRPCLDLHQGKVKQIVGASLQHASGPQVNFTAKQTAGWFADIYKKYKLTGGHIIKLGPGNEQSCREALQRYPGSFRVGGGH